MMEQKTKLTAEERAQDLVITRDFDLPVALLFKAHADADIVAQWMGTQVLKLESKQHGSWQYETRDAQGNVVFRANGVIHTFEPDQKITRTFEIENSPFGVQLELYKFEPLTDDTSRLHMHVIYESAAHREQVLKRGMSKGINMAHDRLQDIARKLKQLS